MAGKVPKYYWLKLSKDFFKRHDIRFLDSLENGHEISLFYLKMLCESVDHNGELRFSDEVPYSARILAGIFEVPTVLAKEALEVLQELHLIKIIEDGTIIMTEVETMIGSETYWATQKRGKRETEVGQELDNVGQQLDTLGQCPENVQQSKSKSIEIDIYKPFTNVKGIESTTPTQIVELYAQTAPSFPAVKTLSDARKKAINARLKVYGLEDFRRLFEKAEASSFLKGANDRNWTATFDWLIKDGNMAKVLDGNYDDKPGRKKKRQQADNPFNEISQNKYDFDELEKKLINN